MGRNVKCSKIVGGCKDDSTIPLSLSALIDDSLLMRSGVDTNYLFPEDESRFHHFPITASSVQMSPHSEVGGDYSEG